MPWDPPGVVDDMTLARLPLPTAQRLLAGTAIVRGATVQTVTEWHGAGPDGDAERGSFAMVRVGGPLEGLVGDRLRVTYGSLVVFAYCHRSADLDDDMSLTRRLFAVFAALDTTNLPVTVDVVDRAVTS